MSANLTKHFTIAHLPPELTQAWLQHVRDFDTKHPGCHFEIGIEGGTNMTMSEMVAQLVVEPKLTFTKIFERKANDDG